MDIQNKLLHGIVADDNMKLEGLGSLLICMLSCQFLFVNAIDVVFGHWPKKMLAFSQKPTIGKTYVY